MAHRTPRQMPRSPIQIRAGASTPIATTASTNPIIYSFGLDPSSYRHYPPMTTLPPDTPPRMSPPRRTTPSASAAFAAAAVSGGLALRVGAASAPRGSSPSLMSPFVPPPPPAPLQQQQQQQLGIEERLGIPQHSHNHIPSVAAAAAPSPSAGPIAVSGYQQQQQQQQHGHYDRVLVDSLTNAKRAEMAAAELQLAEAKMKESSRDNEAKLRAAVTKVRALQMERDNLHRTNLEQSDTIAKLREQIAQFAKQRAAQDRLRNESIQLKERLKEADTKLQESDALRAELHRRLGENERTAHSRATNLSDLRGQIHSKDELVSSLSDTVRARDSTIAQLSDNLQTISGELTKEQSDNKRNLQNMEHVIVQCKEKELLLRQQLSEARSEADAACRDRDHWRSSAEGAQIARATLAQRALDSIVELEMRSRGLLELSFLHYMAQDHNKMFGATAAAASREYASAMNKVARLLDDTDALVKELGTAQEFARHGVQEREQLGAEVAHVRDMATDTMRNLELLTSSASWRRAVLETLIPDEISSSVAQLRAAVAEIVHRTNVASKRALRKQNK